MVQANPKSTASKATDSRWEAVQTRDARQDGQFVYAVASTKIYCRPSCPSRRPKRENVSFFSVPELAERAGYRSCKRCKPQDHASPQVKKMRDICRYIEAHATKTLTLETLSKTFNLSPSHLQRSFKRVVGITPQAYLESCRLETVKAALQEGDDISGASFKAGFGSSSRLYSKSAQHLGMTPNSYKKKGAGKHVTYTVADSPLGKLLVAGTDKGVCAIRLADSEERLEFEMKEEFSQASVERDDSRLISWVEKILRHLEGKEPHLELPLDVRATAFQKQVWQALQDIPYGETRSYAQVAQAIGKPKAVRAVAGACAANPTALAVPCHRVVRSDGSLSGYRWGVERKKALLEQEQASS
mgnify:CR=1 FL=1